MEYLRHQFNLASTNVFMSSIQKCFFILPLSAKFISYKLNLLKFKGADNKIIDALKLQEVLS